MVSSLHWNVADSPNVVVSLDISYKLPNLWGIVETQAKITLLS